MSPSTLRRPSEPDASPTGPLTPTDMTTFETALVDVLAGAAGDWRDQAACKGQTPLFFAPKAERPQARARREKAARALCDACPVAASCREAARRNHEYGFWGGESEDERHLLGFHVMAPIGIRRPATATGAAASFLESA